MNLEMTLKYYCDTVNIPLALYNDGILVRDFFKNRFLPDPAGYYLREKIMERPLLELVTTSDMVLYGFLAVEGTKLNILLGPVREFSCSRDIARRIIKELGQPYSRIDELLEFLAKTPRLSRSKLLKSLVFLNYIINEKSLRRIILMRCQHLSQIPYLKKNKAQILFIIIPRNLRGL